MSDTILLAAVASVIYSSFVGGIVGAHWTGCAGRGFICGLFLGPIGWILAAMKPVESQSGKPIRTKVNQECDICEKELDITDIKPGKYTCPFCGNKLEFIA